MKNMKKVFGIVLALALCLGMAGSALAIGVTPHIPFTKVFNVEEAYTPEVTFTFTAQPYDSGEITREVTNDGNTMTYNVYEGVAFEDDNGTVTITYGGENADQDAQPRDEVNRSFLLPAFESGKPGIYTYRVTETKGNAQGVVYDESAYIVDVYVGTEGNWINTVSEKEGTTDGAKTPIAFENGFETQTLTIEKLVEGNMGDKTKDFDFYITISECDTLPANAELTATKNLANGSTEEVTITIGQKSTFTLKHGEWVSLAGLPKGVAYEADEDTTSKNQEGYTTTDTANTTGLMDNNIDVTVTNTKTGVTPTGIVLSIAPYIAVLVLAGALVALLLMKKKAHNK